MADRGYQKAAIELFGYILVTFWNMPKNSETRNSLQSHGFALTFNGGGDGARIRRKRNCRDWHNAASRGLSSTRK